MEMQLITKLNTIILGGLLLPLTQANAVPNKVIFNHKPSCIEKDLGVISLKTEDLEMLDQEGNPQEKSLSLAVVLLNQKAIEKGADAVIITHVNHRVTNYSSRFKPASDEYVRKTLNTHIQAQAFKMCVDNKALSTIAAPYNADGFKVHQFSYEYTFDIDELSSKSPYKLAQEIKLPPAHVSISEGVYGILLESNIKQTIEKLGPASIELRLAENQFILGYGRNLWFIFNQDKLKKVTSRFELLNPMGQNAIGFRTGFDDTSWAIEGILPQRSTINQVQSELSADKVQHNANQLFIESNQQGLLLEFETFHPEMASVPKQLLTNFTLSHSNKSVKIGSPPNLTTSQKKWLFNRLAPNSSSHFTLDEFTKQIPLATKINIASDDNTWWLAGNHILLRFNDQRLETVKLTDPLFSNVDEDAFASSISAMKLPLDKQGMLTYFSEATDNFEQVDIENDHFSIQAKYESYDNNAPLYELDIFYN
ncbi:MULTISPECIES: hypothetical protein [unclassified Shewanella]|uniref:hypothetical protein n=1 Tax=unclassified Shewanella TaxID=196818 RepID=UPI001BC34A57|nr:MULTISPECIES: hypothetical protein [unclassified Shewanella]GIU08017.1 hypothetical protein TUM4444_08400 [Shewanella sp. MBTL60-112-B1]GIU30705.1 hypothetical protein TUM4445_14380 [Shewanella sp. MBTL60-112-B2]